MYFFVAKCSVEHIPATLCKNYISFASSSVNSKQQWDLRTMTFMYWYVMHRSPKFPKSFMISSIVVVIIEVSEELHISNS